MRRSTPPRLWALLGWLFPASVRDRVFEPACLDLWRDYSLRPNRESPLARLGVEFSFVLCFTATLWYAIPRYLLAPGRLGRPGRAVLLAATALTFVLLAMLFPWIVELVTLQATPAH